MLRYAVKLAGLGLLVAQALTASAAAQPYKLRVATVGVPPSMHTLYMHVAFEEGIYTRNGLAVDSLLQLTSGPLVTQALAACDDVGEALQRCRGLFYACGNGAEARRFNRLLIDAGLIKGL